MLANSRDKILGTVIVTLTSVSSETFLWAGVLVYKNEHRLLYIGYNLSRGDDERCFFLQFLESCNLAKTYKIA